MTKGELIKVLEVFSDDIRIVITNRNGQHTPIKSALYEPDPRGDAVIALVGRKK